MFPRLRLSPSSLAQKNPLIIAVLLAMNLLFNIIGNASFKLSAQAINWKGIVGWQVAGNLAGLVTVLTLTGLLKYLPLHVAQPMVQGLAIIGVQVVASKLFFHEMITPVHWIGILLIIGGIVLVLK